MKYYRTRLTTSKRPLPRAEIVGERGGPQLGRGLEKSQGSHNVQEEGIVGERGAVDIFF